MFFRTKKSGPRAYLQVVENHWRDGRPQQTVLATLGRLDELQADHQVDRLLAVAAEGQPVTIDLETMTVTTPYQDRFAFDLDPFRRRCLMEGLDEVGLTLARDTAISNFEERLDVEADVRAAQDDQRVGVEAARPVGPGRQLAVEQPGDQAGVDHDPRRGAMVQVALSPCAPFSTAASA